MSNVSIRLWKTPPCKLNSRALELFPFYLAKKNVFINFSRFKMRFSAFTLPFMNNSKAADNAKNKRKFWRLHAPAHSETYVKIKRKHAKQFHHSRQLPNLYDNLNLTLKISLLLRQMLQTRSEVYYILEEINTKISRQHEKNVKSFFTLRQRQ